MKLINISPIPSTCNHPDGDIFLSKVFCYFVNFFTFRKSFLNINNLFIGERGSSNILSKSSIGSSFTITINNIISVCPKKKMGGSYTWRIVALMKNVHPFWYFTIVNFPRYSMSRLYLIIKSYLPIGASGIRFRFNSSYPNPAPFCFSNSFPEKFWNYFPIFTYE